MSPERRSAFLPGALLAIVAAAPALAQYANFESSHVHPIALTPDGNRLLAVNTPDALLEIFAVDNEGNLNPMPPVTVGLEPVSVVVRTNTEAWVVNHLSDTVSIVDLTSGIVVRTLPVGDEPTDVAFAMGRAFVAVSQEDALKVFTLSNLSAPPVVVNLFGKNPRALAVSTDGSKVYAVVLHSGNQTAVVNANVIATNNSGLDPVRLANLGLNDVECNGAPPAYPPLPPGIARNPVLLDPAPPAQPPVSLIVKWNGANGKWEDETGADWTHCLPFRLPDHDLFIIDAANPSAAQTFVDHLGTTLFDVSVNPVTGKIYVPHTEARNQVRFEHPLGVAGHIVDNRIAVIDPAAGNAVKILDLNGHINQASDPASNLAERTASVSQPGMIAWNNSGTTAWMTAIGSRKIFKMDGACVSAACLFGPDRAIPEAIEAGEGPTGVALHEAHGRLYVLNRFSNAIAVVDSVDLVKLGEVPLHDPSSAIIRNGRRILYDGIDSSAHGDAACSSCHISGNMDKLAWDLGSPPGGFAPYGTPGDNVRFIVPVGNQPVECPPAQCAAHDGFDPQKGPMTTQTFRGMIEPLHWRGDRGTMNDFNPAFIGLLGREDIGPVNGKPAGLSAAAMELFRQFSLDIKFPPNPFRVINDTVPDAVVSIPGHMVSGNPFQGQVLFSTGRTDANQSCASCHAFPFGTAGGKLGGIEPGDPREALAALFNGTADGSPHSDLKVPHLRNMYEKFGPRFGSHTNPADPPAPEKAGFGFTHDGAVPDMATFLSAGVFTLTAQQVRDISTFMFHFPTGMRPSVGKHLTVPSGPPGPPGSPPELLLQSLITLGNMADPGRHCELTAQSLEAGRKGSWRLDGGIGSGGLWAPDALAAPSISTAALRAGADGPVSFLCATIGSGHRLGGNRDDDLFLNADDCTDGDPAHAASPVEVTGVEADDARVDLLTWDGQAVSVGPALFYEIAGGSLSELGASGLGTATACLEGGARRAAWDDTRADPPFGEGYYYVVRARTSECSGGFAAGQETIEPLSCSGF